MIRLGKVGLLCKLIPDACDATTPVRLRPLVKYPCHLAFGRDAQAGAKG